MRQQLHNGSYSEGGQHEKLANVTSLVQYFDAKPREGNRVGPSTCNKRRKPASRCGQPFSVRSRLELVTLRHQKNLCSVGSSRCGSNGIRQVTKSARLLLMEQTGHRGLGVGQPSPGHQLGPVPTSLLLPPLSTPTAGFGQVQTAGGAQDDPGCPLVAREALLPSSPEHADRCEENPSQQPASCGPSQRESSSGPSSSKTCRVLDFWEIRRERFDISRSAQTLVEASWRGSTEKRYGGAWGQWLEWCSGQGVQAAAPTLSNILDYLASLFDGGAQYRTINLHRSALSSTLKPIDGFCVGQHPLVCRLLKGAFNLRPPRPKLCPTWSVKGVLDTLRDWSPASKLSLKCLSYKTAMLVALATAKRPGRLTLLSTKEGFWEVSQSQARSGPIELEKTEGL